jgi:hypothetical protein
MVGSISGLSVSFSMPSVAVSAAEDARSMTPQHIAHLTPMNVLCLPAWC